MMLSHLSAWSLAVISPDQQTEKDFPGIFVFSTCMKEALAYHLDRVRRRMKFNTAVCQEVSVFKSQGGYVLKVSV